MLVSDQLHRILQISKTPTRIVSLVPSQTELLVDLGLKSSLVGITKFCVHPANLRKEITVVGGTKQVHLDKIEALNPDIIICNKEENTLEMVDACSKIAPVWVSDIATIDDNLKMIEQFGHLFQVPEKAIEVSDLITSEKQKFKHFIASKPKKKVVYLIWKDPYMAAGNDTFIHHLLQLNHFENCILTPRYPEVVIADFKEADLVLLSSEPYPFKEKHISEIQEKTNAIVQLVDGEYFSWYGSRLREAFTYFKTLHI